jgi:hypothetical protein
MKHLSMPTQMCIMSLHTYSYNLYFGSKNDINFCDQCPSWWYGECYWKESQNNIVLWA